MGLDLDVLLLIGVDYDDVIEKISDYVNVTKYNPDDGTPYQVSKEKVYYKIGSHIFESVGDAEEALLEAGLEVYGNNVDELALIGIELDKNKGNRVATGLGGYVSEREIKVAFSAVSESLSRLGVDMDYVGIHVRTYSTASW